MAILGSEEFGAMRRGSRMIGANCAATTITGTIGRLGASGANCTGTIANCARIVIEAGNDRTIQGMRFRHQPFPDVGNLVGDAGPGSDYLVLVYLGGENDANRNPAGRRVRGGGW